MPAAFRSVSLAVAAAVLAVQAGLARGAEAATIPFPRRLNPPVLLSLPSANLLGHGQFMLSGRFQYFNTSVIGDTASGATDPVESSVITYNSELLFGVENRAELGVQYGKELALSLKALLVREDVFWPDLVFGARNLFGSPEGGLYGLEDEEVLEGLRGESYFTVAKTFPSKSRVHLGMSYLAGLEDGRVGVNAGLEQDLGKGAYLGYEVFERFSDFHQVLSLNWRWKDYLSLSVGLTEFQSWIRQDGSWGFFLTPDRSRPDGYNSPGLTFNLQVLGFAPRRQKRTLPERVALLEVRNVELERRLLEMQEALLKVQAAPGSPGGTGGPTGPSGETARQVAGLLKSAASMMASESADPGEVRKLMTSILTLGPAGDEALRAIAADSLSGDLRVPALLTMAFSRDSAHAPALRALTSDPDPQVRREALTGLLKVQPASALEDARRLLQDPDESVALAAGEAYRLLGGAPAPARAPAAKAAAPAAKAATPAAKAAKPAAAGARPAPSARPAAAPKAPAGKAPTAPADGR